MNTFQREILFAMNRTGKPMYGGTVSPQIIAKRRAADKIAKQSRKRNR